MAVLSGCTLRSSARAAPRNDSTMIPPRISDYPIDNLQIAALAAVLRNKMLNCTIQCSQSNTKNKFRSHAPSCARLMASASIYVMCVHFLYTACVFYKLAIVGPSVLRHSYMPRRS